MSEINIGTLIDSLYALRAKRLELEKVVEGHKQEEQRMRDEIIAILNTTGLRGAKGMAATAALVHKTKPQVTDWDQVYNYIRSTGEFGLLHKRITEGLWGALREDGFTVPGTEPIVLTDLSLTKGAK